MRKPRSSTTVPFANYKPDPTYAQLAEMTYLDVMRAVNAAWPAKYPKNALPFDFDKKPPAFVPFDPRT